MNIKQRILTYVVVAIVSPTFFFVPWRVSDHLGEHYEFSAYWHPVPLDEGGVLHPVLLYMEWGILAIGYIILFRFMRTKQNKS